MTERPTSGGARQASGVEHGIDLEPVALIPDDLVKDTGEESFPGK